MAVVLITGCSSGFGLLTALAFARRGDRTYATMRDTSRSGALVEAAAAEGLEVVVRQLDVTDRESARECVEVVLEAEGRLDVLVNNAGVNHLGSVELLPEDLLRDVFETNFFGALRLIRAVLPTMRAQGSGVIVNVSSGGGRIPGTPMGLAYSASKHALGVLTDCLAAEVGDMGIRAVVVEPGYYRTPFLDRSPRDRERETPYEALERAMWKSIDENYQKAPDPTPVADAIVAVATEPDDRVHVPIGEEAEGIIAAARTLSDAEWQKMIREMIGV